MIQRKIKIYSLIYSLIFVTCCHRTGNVNSLQTALPKASVFVEKYGQVVSKKELSYLNYLQNRLSQVLVKSSRKNKNYKILLLNTKIPIASYAGEQIILISKGILVPAQYEAEFAFILAHEMAHQHLGHNPDDSNENNSSTAYFSTSDESDEIDADRLAIATIAAAGYDPRYSISALRKVYSYAAPYILNDNNYPSLDKRVSEIESFMESSGWRPPGTINRKEYADFRRNLMSK